MRETQDRTEDVDVAGVGAQRPHLGAQQGLGVDPKRQTGGLVVGEPVDAQAGVELTIGELSERSGVATSALRFYEGEELIHASRSPGGQRRFARDTLRRVSFIRVAQTVGLSLEEIRSALASLPQNRTPNENDWEKLSKSWRPRLDYQIRMLERLRDRLDRCIGCGCLSLRFCKLMNPDDQVAERGPGPRYVLDDN